MQVVPDMASMLECFGQLKQFWRAVLNFYLLVAQLSAAVQYLTCWKSFPGIGSDGLRMNRLFACVVSNKSVCWAVDMQVKILLL